MLKLIEMKNLQPSYTIDEATKKIENYCVYQDRCHKEVENKLREMGMIPIATNQIIGHLIQENYLNEERFARSYARGKFNIKKWGKKRIVNELKQREISKYNITSALQEIDEDTYLKTLDVLAKKKLASLTEKNLQKRRKKVSDYLLYRGWESHLVYEKVTTLVK
jgi:regulatory protein